MIKILYLSRFAYKTDKNELKLVDSINTLKAMSQVENVV